LKGPEYWVGRGCVRCALVGAEMGREYAEDASVDEYEEFFE
jgi:hypothetical protein